MPFCSTLRSVSRRLPFAVLLALAATGMLSGAAPTAAGSSGAYAVIASKGVPVDELSSEELRRILTFKRTLWRTNQPITLLLPASSLPARHFLLTRMYRMTEEELRRFILQRIFQAEIDFAPKVVDVERDAVAFVASGQSVLAVVSSGTPGLATVKVLRIDGRLPADPKYPLQ